MPDDSEVLLRAILNVTARSAFPPKKLVRIVRPPGASEKQIKAYNLCDGSNKQGEIAKSLKLDSGNFSKTVNRWIDEGVVYRLGEGRDARLLHLYPLTKDADKEAGEL